MTNKENKTTNNETLNIARTLYSKHTDVNRIIRDGEWILYKIHTFTMFLYNVNTNKNYFYDVNSSSDTIKSITFNNKRAMNYLDAIDSSLPWYNIYPVCLNENDEEILPNDCFKGTIVERFLKAEKDWPCSPTYTYVHCENQDSKTIAEISAQHMIPIYAYKLLLLPKKAADIAEKMFNLKLNGLLTDLLHYRSVCGEKHLERIFKLSLDKLKIVDKLLVDRLNKIKYYDFKFNNYLTIDDIYTIFGDDLKTISTAEFEHICEWILKNEIHIGSTYAGKFYHILRDSGKTPAQIYSFLKNYDCMSFNIYLKYLASRDTFMDHVADNEILTKMAEKYTILPPNSAHIYICLKDYDNWVKPVSAASQFNKIQRMFLDDAPKSKVLPDIDSHKNIIGCTLHLDQIGWLIYMQYELNNFCIQYAVEHSPRIDMEVAELNIKNLAKYEYRGDELSIVAPKNITELIINEEATNSIMVVHRCINYKGLYRVLYIRRNDCLDKPFYMIQLDKNNNVLSIQGDNYCGITENNQKQAYKQTSNTVYDKVFNITEFLLEWANKRNNIKINVAEYLSSMHLIKTN